MERFSVIIGDLILLIRGVLVKIMVTGWMKESNKLEFHHFERDVTSSADD